MPKPAQQTSFSLALNEVAADGTASPVEMAHAAGCSESHMRDVISICDSTQLSLEKAIRLSAWLVDERSETRQLVGADEASLPGLLGSRAEVHFAPTGFENDDEIRTEILDARQDAGRAIEAFDEGDRTRAAKELRKGIADMTRALQDVQEPAEEMPPTTDS